MWHSLLAQIYKIKFACGKNNRAKNSVLNEGYEEGGSVHFLLYSTYCLYNFLAAIACSLPSLLIKKYFVNILQRLIFLRVYLRILIKFMLIFIVDFLFIGLSYSSYFFVLFFSYAAAALLASACIHCLLAIILTLKLKQ